MPVVDDHARLHSSWRCAREVAVRAHAGREDHELGGEHLARGEPHARDRLVARDLLDLRAAAHRRGRGPSRWRSSRRPAGSASWRGSSQPKPSTTVTLQAAAGERAGGLEPEQPAADADAGRAPGARAPGGRAASARVRSASTPSRSTPGMRRDEGVRAGGEDQPVVGQRAAVAQPHLARASRSMAVTSPCRSSMRVLVEPGARLHGEARLVDLARQVGG